MAELLKKNGSFFLLPISPPPPSPLLLPSFSIRVKFDSAGGGRRAVGAFRCPGRIDRVGADNTIGGNKQDLLQTYAMSMPHPQYSVPVLNILTESTCLGLTVWTKWWHLMMVHATK